MESIIAMTILVGAAVTYNVTTKPGKNLQDARRKNYCTQFASAKLNSIRSKGMNGIKADMDTNCSFSCPCVVSESYSDLVAQESNAAEFMKRLPMATRHTYYDILNVRNLKSDCTKYSYDVGRTTGLLFKVRVYVTFQEYDGDGNLIVRGCELTEAFNPFKISTTTTLRAIDDACSYNSQCASGYCDSGPSTCQPGPPPPSTTTNLLAIGDPCNFNSECVSAYCQIGGSDNCEAGPPPQ